MYRKSDEIKDERERIFIKSLIDAPKKQKKNTLFAFQKNIVFYAMVSQNEPLIPLALLRSYPLIALFGYIGGDERSGKN